MDSQLCNYYPDQVPLGKNETIQCKTALIGSRIIIQKLPLTAEEATGIISPKVLILCQVLVGGYLPRGKSHYTSSWD